MQLSLSAGVCPLKVLVGANSPSLCPTISSDIVIGINDLPLWIKKLCPTKSGIIVESLDQVLIGFLFVSPSLILSIFLIN